jgi:putative nucleotidyltransferase with HDIG domain
MWMPSREEAINLLREHIRNENLVRHMVATEAIMRALAPRLGGDPDLWGITGLLHDMDLEIIDDDMHRHAKTTVEILRGKGYPEAGLQAILAHNGDVLGIDKQGNFDHALSAAETITGMIVACTLVYPSRKVADVKPKSIRKRMKEHRFAANVDRERIRLIEEVGISLDDFIVLSLEAMQTVADEIGL